MSKHTPGPWNVGPFHEANACVSVTAECGTEVAVFYDGDPDAFKGSDGIWGDQPTRDANARLASAAPDMLEALKRIRETGAFVGAIAQEMMDAAIAKAEGRS